MANAYEFHITYAEKPKLFFRNWRVKVTLAGAHISTQERCKHCKVIWKGYSSCNNCWKPKNTYYDDGNEVLFSAKAWTEAQAEMLAKQFTKSYDKASDPKTTLYSNDPAAISEIMEKRFEAEHQNGGNVLDAEIQRMEDELNSISQRHDISYRALAVTIYPGDALVTSDGIKMFDRQFRYRLREHEILVLKSGKIVRAWG